MGEESRNSTVTAPTRAVFLSYASQDAEAARKICDVLRAAGIEVWFDQSELRGGDAWDRQIRKQIHDCRLFIALISAHTESRDEGYFRREWKLAVERTGDLAADVPFLVPVVIDGTSEAAARVPDEFLRVQWTRLPSLGNTTAFVERISRLLSPGGRDRPSAVRVPDRPQRKRWQQIEVVLFAAAAVSGAGYLAYDKFWVSKSSTPPAASAGMAAAAFAPPPHSVAVLPFVNMSGDKEQEYFSDGLTEELLNALTEVEGLQVAGRTSSFYFKGKDVDLGTVAHKLNVGAVLEGSVRRSGSTVRVTTQLINAVTGFHLWSHTYDRNLGDVLKLETEIAGAVAAALKVSLLGDVAPKIELGGTRNPAAFDAYLRASKAYGTYQDGKDLLAAIAGYTEAIRLDPSYALAFAARSIPRAIYAGNYATGTAIRESFDNAHQDALKAVALAPDLAEGHLALALYFDTGMLDPIRENAEFERALALAPGNARILRDYGEFAVMMGRQEAGIAAARRAVSLDPLNDYAHVKLGGALIRARQYDAAVAAFQDALAIDPRVPYFYVYLGLAYYAMGNLQGARESCVKGSRFPGSQVCLAMTYDKLGRHTDAEAMLAKYRAAKGDAGATDYADIYAQWGNNSKALEWLEFALRMRDPGLGDIKTDALLDPLREEPRFQAIERELKFPE